MSAISPAQTGKPSLPRFEMSSMLPSNQSRFSTGERFQSVEDVRSFVAGFREKHGRAPRVLHIGNIANNAYHNSKLLNDVGMDCDVLCYNYYHIMGCPEWEDADFSGPLGDDNAPRWHRVRKRGYRRPRWFAQGRLQTCVAYLKARRRNRPIAARALWQLMAFERRNIKHVLLAERIYRGVRRRCRSAQIRTFGWLRGTARRLKSANRKLWRLMKSSPQIRGGVTRRLSRPVLPPLRDPTGTPRTEDLNERRSAVTAQSPIPPLAGPPSEYEVIKGELRESFRDSFANRPDQLVEEDFTVYGYVPYLLPELFDEYDIILGYATDPILPLLAGKRFFALEHGTLREIPFEGDTRGRLTALAYNRAEHVFVTNSDCVDNAHTLAADRVTFINHPFDDRLPPPDRKQHKLRQTLQDRLDAEHLIFFPTRQDWVQGTGFADKANDIMLRAFARLRRNGLKVGMVCTNWGRNVEESRQLLADLGVDRHVQWESPMGMVQFTRTARACGLVADQFKLGAFGGVFYKSMACGVPVCTYLDDATIVERFGASIPCLNVRTENDIVSQLTQAYQNPGWLEELGRASRAWVDEFHTSSETVCKQMRAFAPFLERLDPPDRQLEFAKPRRAA